MVDMVAFGDSESESNSVHVSFLNNASPAYDIQFDTDEKNILKQPYSWFRDSNSRYNLVSYSIDGGDFTPISRLPRGTFTIDIPTDSTTIVFSSVVQYPISIDGVKGYVFYPKSPTNDNWFDEKSKILINEITSPNSSMLPNHIVGWDGPVLNHSGNSVYVLVDSPIHLTAQWDTNNSFLVFLVLIPVVGIIVFFINRIYRKKGTKTIPDNIENKIKYNHENYELEILDFVKEKSIEQLELLNSTNVLSTEKKNKIKKNLETSITSIFSDI